MRIVSNEMYNIDNISEKKKFFCNLRVEPWVFDEYMRVGLTPQLVRNANYMLTPFVTTKSI